MLCPPFCLLGSTQTTNETTNQTETPSTSSPATVIHSKGDCPVQLMGLLKVKWTSACKGDVELLPHQQTPPSLVCHSSQNNVAVFLKAACQERRGCKGNPTWHEGRPMETCYDIQDSGVLKQDCCGGTLSIHCSGEETQWSKLDKYRYRCHVAVLFEAPELVPCPHSRQNSK